MESAAVGDEVVILTGTYTMSDPLSINGSGTVVHGEANQPRPTLQTSGFTGVLVSNSNATLRDLTIEHTGLGFGLSLSGLGERVSVRSTDPTADGACNLSLLGRLRDSTCSTTAANAPAIRAAMSGAFTNMLRLRNVTGVSTAGYGLLARAQTGNTLTVDVKATVARGGGGFVDVRSETDGSGGASTTLTLANSSYATATAGAASTVTTAGSATNQTAAPLFANQATGDFHQLAGSPTINAGVVDAESGSTDLDREPRTQGSAPDIGADEFDEIAPVVSITAGPGEGETISVPTAAFGFAADDATATLSCELDGGGFGPCTGPGNSHSVAGLADGAHTFSVRATDASGNVGTASRAFGVSLPQPPPAVDNTPPETTITKSPASKTEKTKAKFKFTSNEPGSTFECKLDKRPYKPCTSPRRYKRLDEGKHKFRVRATDPAGNVELKPAKDKWKVVEP